MEKCRKIIQNVGKKKKKKLKKYKKFSTFFFLYLQAYLYPTFGTDKEAWKKASPILHLLELDTNVVKLPPFLLVNATYDLGLEKGK